MAEKVSLNVTQKTADMIGKYKEPDESIDAFLQRIISYIVDEDAQRRVLFIGPPAAGKSTIRRVFFEDSNPGDLLEKSLEPTRGIENYTYNWLDVVAGVADSAGQEIERWLGLDQELAFQESDSIIFVLDAYKFQDYQDQILDDIQSALTIKKKYAPKAQFNLFLHKIDLFEDDEREEKLAEVKNSINHHLEENGLKEEMILLKYYYTSIKGNLILSLVKAMRSVLYSYSKIMKRALIPYSMRL